ncbi:OmpA family protein [Aliivibrio wodanis]|uniref:Outer membrane protein, OmpA family n=1 Tax=Aliivibrio wodanis TaxID=80852 RepID=A0A090I6S7_9GAMM|nr:outer membrane protein, OmpA family [Aliivibrio wodanis]VVV06229.1 Outer membrane porin F [Aliivibrio wodanis]
MLRILLFCVSLLLVGCASQGTNLLDTAPKTKNDAPHPTFEDEYKESPEQVTNGEVTHDLTGPNGELKDDDMRKVATELSKMGITYHQTNNEQLIITIQEKVYFSTAKSNLTPSAKSLLNKIISIVASKPELALVLDGHTDATGNSVKNQNLSELRSNEVRRYLLANKVHPSQLYSRGFGEYLPLCDNRTLLGRKCNRRVEITILKMHWDK